MHTNQTQYYNLPQYVGSDIINPLTDTNGAYETIDTTLHNIAEAQSGDASDITDLQTKVGSDVLTTSAPDLSGAVNEIDAELDTADTGIKARLLTAEGEIDTLQSQMVTAQGNITDLQNNKADATALTALENSVGGISILHSYQTIEVTADGVKTNKELIDSAIASVVSVMEANPTHNYELLNLIVSQFWLTNYRQAFYNSSLQFAANFHGSNLNNARTAIDIRDIDVSSNAVTAYDEALITVSNSSITANDLMNSVPTNGDKIYLHYREYRPVKS